MQEAANSKVLLGRVGVESNEAWVLVTDGVSIKVWELVTGCVRIKIWILVAGEVDWALVFEVWVPVVSSKVCSGDEGWIPDDVRNEVWVPVTEDVSSKVWVPVAGDVVWIPVMEDVSTEVWVPVAGDVVWIPVMEDVSTEVWVPVAGDVVWIPVTEDVSTEVWVPVAGDTLVAGKEVWALVMVGLGCVPVAGDKVWVPVAGDKVWVPVAGDKVWVPVAGDKVWVPVAGDEVWVPLTEDVSIKVWVPVVGDKVWVLLNEGVSSMVWVPVRYSLEVAASTLGKVFTVVEMVWVLVKVSTVHAGVLVEVFSVGNMVWVLVEVDMVWVLVSMLVGNKFAVGYTVCIMIAVHVGMFAAVGEVVWVLGKVLSVDGRHFSCSLQDEGFLKSFSFLRLFTSLKSTCKRNLSVSSVKLKTESHQVLYASVFILYLAIT